MGQSPSRQTSNKLFARFGAMLSIAGTTALWYASRKRHWSAGEVVLAGSLWTLILLVVHANAVKRIFGPVFFHEIVKLGRRRLTFFTRVLYALLLMLSLVWAILLSDLIEQEFYGSIRPSTISNFATEFFEIFMVGQLAVVSLLTPIYAAGTITDEKERKTLEFLFTTDLSDLEIIFGKMAARVVLILMYVLAGLPLISILQLFGGIDPDQLLAGTAATIITVVGLATIGIYFSVVSKSSRDAIILAYVAPFLYVAGSALIAGFCRYGLPQVSTWNPNFLGIKLADATDWLVAGNIVYVVPEMLETSSRSKGTQFDPEALANILVRYAVFWSVSIAILLGYCSRRLRSIALKQKEKLTRLPRRRLGRIFGRSRPQYPPIGDDPMFWKEVHVERSRLGFTGYMIGGLSVFCIYAFPILAACVLFWDYIPGINRFLDVPRSAQPYESRMREYAESLSGWVRAATGIFGTLAMLSSLMRGASSIGGERDRDTLISLISTPLTAGEMIRGKWFGCFISGRKLMCLLIPAWIWAWIFGALQPVMILPVVVYLALFVSAFSWLGILCSVSARTTLIASVRALFAGVFFSGGFWLIFVCCEPTFMYLLRHFFAYGNEEVVDDLGGFMLLGCTPPFIVGWLPLPDFQTKSFAPFNKNHVQFAFHLAFVGLFVWIGLNFLFRNLAYSSFLKTINRPTIDT